MGAGLAMAILAVVAIAHVDDPLHLSGGLALGAVLIAISARRLAVRAAKRRRDREVLERPVDAVRARLRGHPYRGALRRAGRRVAPPISGPTAAVVVAGSLAAAAIAAPLVMAQPLWIEIEVVLAIWWVVLSVTLAVLLYRGARIARDL
jgi:hypothetical protein